MDKTFKEQQISRAQKMIETPESKRRGKNQNGPVRFAKSESITPDGEVASKKIYELDIDRIKVEEK